MHHDVIVMGSNEAGCAAALEGSKRGLDVLLIDDGCLSPDALVARGSLPMHHMREAIVRYMDFARAFDRCSGTLRLDAPQLRRLARRTRELGKLQSEALRRLLTSNGVEVISERARFLAHHRVLLESHQVREAPIIVMACGNEPRRPERFAFDGRVVCDEWSVIQFDRIPRKLLIIGAEAIGCEVACLFASLGSEVTLLDRRARMLRYADRDIIGVLHERMRALGVDVVLDETLDELGVNKNCAEPHAVAQLGSGRIEKFDRVLVAAGKRVNFDGLGLDRAGIERDASGFIVTDDHYCTFRAGVYAVGDAIAGSSDCTHTQAGRVAIRHAMNLDSEISGGEAIITIYSMPEISMIGLTEEMCERLEISHAVGVGRYEDLSHGQIRGDREGMVKLVAGRQDRRLLGVHVIGTCARELVQLGASSLHRGDTADALANSVFSRPSLMEAYAMAACDCVDQLESEAAC